MTSQPLSAADLRNTMSGASKTSSPSVAARLMPEAEPVYAGDIDYPDFLK